MTLFKARNLCAGYGDKIVIDNIDLTIDKGDFISIIGPNGAGKSTLLKVLSYNIRPIRGTVRYKDILLQKYDRLSYAREISVVHQFIENLLPFSVYEFIRMGRFPHQRLWQIETKEDKEIIEKALEVTGISDFRHRTITELSGGERQLVFIAQALVQSSKVMLLDEPISHLDISHSIKIMDILYHLSINGTTIITVLHDINIASNYCKRIIALKNGNTFFDGAPQDVVTFKLIEELFNTPCIVIENPITKKPFTFPLPGYVKGNYSH
ncbi:MAG: ABC transporter ATP-binding protein [Spirochaetota bacterium]|nr:ABC transporter ATP-binding protein [Spirochaetota bacterium]